MWIPFTGLPEHNVLFLDQSTPVRIRICFVTCPQLEGPFLTTALRGESGDVILPQFLATPPNFALQPIIQSNNNFALHIQVQVNHLPASLPVSTYPSCRLNSPVYRNPVAAIASPSRPVTGCFGSCLSSTKVPVVDSQVSDQQGATLCT